MQLHTRISTNTEEIVPFRDVLKKFICAKVFNIDIDQLSTASIDGVHGHFLKIVGHAE